MCHSVKVLEQLDDSIGSFIDLDLLLPAAWRAHALLLINACTHVPVVASIRSVVSATSVLTSM